MSSVPDLRLLVSESPTNHCPVPVNCPYHGDKIRPNLNVYVDHAYCFACGKYVSPLNLIQQLRGVSLEEAQTILADLPTTVLLETAEVKVDPIPLGIVEQYQKQLVQDKAALSWLKKRGLLPKTISEYKLGYTTWAYTIPIYSDRELVNIKFRRDDSKPHNPKAPKYWGLPHRKTELYEPQPVTEGCIIIVTEGEYDALVAGQLEGYVGLSLTQGANSPLSDAAKAKLSLAKTIILAYDQDVPGYLAPLRLAPKLDNEDIRIASWTPSWGKDLSEVWVNKGQEKVLSVVQAAKRWKRA